MIRIALISILLLSCGAPAVDQLEPCDVEGQSRCGTYVAVRFDCHAGRWRESSCVACREAAQHLYCTPR